MSEEKITKITDGPKGPKSPEIPDTITVDYSAYSSAWARVLEVHKLADGLVELREQVEHLSEDHAEQWNFSMWSLLSLMSSALNNVQEEMNGWRPK